MTQTLSGRSYWLHVYSAVALTSSATLLLELSITRLFSVLLYYHFAFMAISIALFGLGVGGILSYAIARWKGSIFSKLGGLAILNGLATVLCLLFILSREGRLDFKLLCQMYFSSAVPFVLAGMILSLAISETIDRVHRVYFFDLGGRAQAVCCWFPCWIRSADPMSSWRQDCFTPFRGRFGSDLRENAGASREAPCWRPGSPP